MRAVVRRRKARTAELSTATAIDDKLPVILSIHDVMPHTLDKVDDVLTKLSHYCHNTIYLLVVPGLSWDGESMERLRGYVNDGHYLVAHGWHHRAAQVSSFKHRLHSQFISRNVAEHLCLTTNEIIELMQRSRAWFTDNSLSSPSIYVPPAWALGNVSIMDLQETGFDWIETSNGFINVKQKQHRYHPLLGYETDTWIRAIAVTCWNTANEFIAQQLNHPHSQSGHPRTLRLSIHPNDFQLKLQSHLHRTLQRVRSVSIPTQSRTSPAWR